MRSISRSAAPLVLALLALSAARAEQDVARTVAELRDKGQYGQAEMYALQEWGRTDVSDRERAELAIQLALLYTNQALTAQPETREVLWDKADRACAALVEGWPDNPRRVLVDVQRALVGVARGQQARELAQVPPALEHLRAATRALQEIADQVGRRLIELRLRGAASRGADELGVPELESLEAHIAFHLARVQRQLGLCYPNGSNDRDDALLQAERRLAPLAEQISANELVWNARVELLACRRDLGRAEEAERQLRAWLRESPPAEVIARLAPEEAPAATVHAASSNPVVSAVDDRNAGFGVELSAAELERRAGRYAVAAERYRALAVRQPGHSRAADAHRLAILARADALRQTPPDDQVAATNAYEQLLREHLAHWPTAVSADEARLWLGQLLAARREWPAAIETLQHVRADAATFSESVRLLADCYEQRLQQFRAADNAGQEAAAVLSEATHRLQPIITGAENRWPESWTELQRETAIALARLHLRYSPQPSDYAERLLKSLLQGSTSNSGTPEQEAWQATARVLLLTALARSGKMHEADDTVDQLAPARADALLECLAGIDALLTDSALGKDAQRELGELILVILPLVEARRAELDQVEVVKLDCYRAAALAATGNRAAALTLYGAIASRSPDNGEVQERYASLLAQSQIAAELRAAVTRWQEVESRSRRGGSRWRRAREARIELLTRLGEMDEAEKLQRLTRLLYADGAPAPAAAATE